MNKAQRDDYLAFAGNFTALLCMDGFSAYDAGTALRAAGAALLGIVWKLSPEGPEAARIQEYVKAVNSATMKLIYGQEVAG